MDKAAWIQILDDVVGIPQKTNSLKCMNQIILPIVMSK